MSSSAKRPMQSGLPPVTQYLWRDLEANFPSIDHLEAWGDRSHSARRSDHNSVTSSGQVGPRAIDVFLEGATGNGVKESGDHLRARNRLVLYALEPTNRKRLRISLVISNRVYWSARTGWRPAPYRGVNAHLTHVHLSCDARILVPELGNLSSDVG